MCSFSHWDIYTEHVNMCWTRLFSDLLIIDPFIYCLDCFSCFVGRHDTNTQYCTTQYCGLETGFRALEPGSFWVFTQFISTLDGEGLEKGSSEAEDS